MNRLDRAFKWAQAYEFSSQELEYATILQLKILDQKCQMTQEDQELFKSVYEGIFYKVYSPFSLEIHQLIKDATGDALQAKEPYTILVHNHRMHYETSMKRPVMKAYKAMVREALGEA